ncbi:MAG: DM13 domain-containing protein [Cyclobacteriaceae bacterium]
MKIQHIIFLVFTFISGCIGTDYQNDPKDSAIMIDVSSVTLTKGDTEQITATYWFNMWVQDTEVQLNWISENPSIATVDQTGLISAIEKGQTTVYCFAAGEDTTNISVSVVDDPDDVAKVTINGESSSILVGESLQLSAEGFNTEDELITSTNPPTWNSSDESILTVDNVGLVMAVSDGMADITATIDDVVSQPYPIIVGKVARVGIFMDANGYSTSGMVTLSEDDSGDLILELHDDFKTSFAVGTFLYLANSTSGSVVASQGLEVSEITGNGGATYNLTQIKSDISIDDYQYVISLCKPFTITFGSAELQ